MSPNGDQLPARVPPPSSRPPSSEGMSAFSTRRLIDAFLSGRNERTIRAYRQDLEDFRVFMKAETLDGAAKALLSRGHGEANGLTLEYRTALLGRGLSPATVNRRLAAIRSLVALARTLGIVPWMLEVSGVKSERYRDTRGPGLDGFRALLRLLDGRQDRKAIRDRAILRLLFDLALRRGEVVGLDLEDLDLDVGTLAVLGKGRSEKIRLTLPEPTRESLRAWVGARGSEPGPLFLNLDHAKKGSRLTGRSLHRIVVSLGRKAGVRVRPHGLRHAAVTEALDATGGDVRKVARFSRHRQISTVLVYDDARQDLGGEVARIVAGRVGV